MNVTSYFPALVLLALIGVLHNIVGIHISAYTDIWWWDILLHYLGGIWVALSGFWYFYYSGIIKNHPRTTVDFLITTIVPVLIIGGAWEIFEYVAGITFILPGEHYEFDTIGDFFVDTAGALTVYVYYRLKHWKDFI